MCTSHVYVHLSVCRLLSLVWVPAPPLLLPHESPLTVHPPSSSLILTDSGFCPRTQPGTRTCRAPVTPQMVKQRVAFSKRHGPANLSFPPWARPRLCHVSRFEGSGVAASFSKHLSSRIAECQAPGTGRPALAPELLRLYGKNASLRMQAGRGLDPTPPCPRGWILQPCLSHWPERLFSLRLRPAPPRPAPVPGRALCCRTRLLLLLLLLLLLRLLLTSTGALVVGPLLARAVQTTSHTVCSFSSLQ